MYYYKFYSYHLTKQIGSLINFLLFYPSWKFYSIRFNSNLPPYLQCLLWLSWAWLLLTYISMCFVTPKIHNIHFQQEILNVYILVENQILKISIQLVSCDFQIKKILNNIRMIFLFKYMLKRYSKWTEKEINSRFWRNYSRRLVISYFYSIFSIWYGSSTG